MAVTTETTTASALRSELHREAETTRRLLERLPEASLGWRPHARSKTLGGLALHLARLPGAFAQLLDHSTLEVPEAPDEQPTTRAEVLDALERGVAELAARLDAWGDAGLAAEWTLTVRGEPLLRLQRRDAVRTLVLNHSYHHRGQLSVYLRLLDVPLPPVYGDTADERFAP